ncbi:MAG: thioredoxin domain-containing protein [Thiotrichales bacterium]|nr:thioredoxin domain-containing protein [Thiotrichales bacterium]
MTHPQKLTASWLIIMAAIVGLYLIKDTQSTSSSEHTQTPKPHEIWVPNHAPIIGPFNAPVTLVEFIDPACEACRAMYPYVKAIMKKHPNDVRLVIRYVNFHTQSEEAIRILEAARKQNQFETVLEVLLAFQPAWAPHHKEGVDPWLFVEKTALNIEQAKQDALDPNIANIITLDMADVEAAGVKKTPSFFVNGKPLTLMHPDPLLEMIETALKEAKEPSS